jgi:ABC-type polysaccharide/polyol phosphate transport system ATPase subunit
LNAGVTAAGVGVRFLFDRENRVVTPTLARLRRRGPETWGLRDISFHIGPGEGVALIGASGSGKTTLLRTLASVLVPDEGRLEVSGRIGSLLSIEAGLLSTLTGRENALLIGVLAGVPLQAMRARLDDVRELSRLGDNFERPVSSFSQGMRARLGFAAAEQLDPEVLLLDEVHEAFDHEYRDVVERQVAALLSRGGIIVAAGHDHPMLARLCDRALLLEKGQLKASGPREEIVEAYLGG